MFELRPPALEVGGLADALRAILGAHAREKSLRFRIEDHLERGVRVVGLVVAALGLKLHAQEGDLLFVAPGDDGQLVRARTGVDLVQQALVGRADGAKGD